MENRLKQLITTCEKEVSKCTQEADLLRIKSKYLGKKSELSSLFIALKTKPLDVKKKEGNILNTAKIELETIINQRFKKIMGTPQADFDDTLPVELENGSLHPITIVGHEVTAILKRMGFTILSGPEMEKEYYNFIALNIPDTHPARDMQDTYWLSNGDLLRTHTSPLQVRAMQKYQAPLRICAPGRVFRNEDLDASHENTFFQIEGMVIAPNVSIRNLLYVMKGMLKEVFQKDVKVRLRPGYFPFTEPSFELDCSCLLCNGKGCPTCKNTGWIELCPCGMIHPQVLEMSKIDSQVYTGFAFGLGLTRLAMMKYKINDIRVLNSGDIRILREFEGK